MKKRPICYKAPVGIELQHEHLSTSPTECGKPCEVIGFHTDAYLIAKFNDLKMSKATQDLVLSRLQERKDILPADLQPALDKLNDFQFMETMSSSRFEQTLSDRQQQMKDLMNRMDDVVKSEKDKRKAEELDLFSQSLRKLSKMF